MFRLTLCTLAAGAVLAQVVAIAPAARSAGSVTRCGLVMGAPWKIELSGQAFTGATYAVSTQNGASCALARSWVPRLTREAAALRVPGDIRGPAGWLCRVFFGRPSLQPLRAAAANR